MMCPFCQLDVDQFDPPADGGTGLRCPRCEMEGVPLLYPTDYERHPAVPVGIFGPTGHGKSVYIDALLTHLERRVEWPLFSCQWMDQTAMLEARQRLRILREHGQLPNTTARIFPRPQVMRLRNVPAVGGCQLLFYDTNGETFQEVENLREDGRYLKNSKAIVWLVSLTDLEYPEQLSDLMTVYAEAMTSIGGDPSKQAVILTLTKGDLLREREDFPAEAKDFLLNDDLDPAGDAWDRLTAVSAALEKWLTRGPQRNVVNLLRGQFRAVRLCVVSAQGAAARDQVLDLEIAPKGVLAPLFWLWRETRPVAWLEAGGERRPFFNLADAVAVARAGNTLFLEAAWYTLSARLEVRHPIRVVGRGAGQTVIASAAPDFALGVSVGAGTVELRNLSLFHTGSAPADVVRVVKGEVALHACTVRGGVALLPKVAGDGVRVADGGATLVGGAVENNAGSGVSAAGGGRLTLTGTAVRNNEWAGVWAGGAAAEVRDCEVTGNAANGVVLDGRVVGTVHKTTCKKNRRSGVRVTKAALAELHNNACEENGRDGITAEGEAVVSLAGNKCSANRRAGVSVRGTVTGSVAGGKCMGNTGPGIEVEDKAAPTVDGNSCERNAGAGIAYSGEAGGECLRNTCTANVGDGIAVVRRATPAVDGNACERNGGAGVRVADGAAPKVGKGNAARDNAGGDFEPPKLGRRGWFA